MARTAYNSTVACVFVMGEPVYEATAITTGEFPFTQESRLTEGLLEMVFSEA
jgi:hypothetical protein